jgi:hypothetical protein
MRRIPLLLATVWTLTYMFAAQAAIATDLAATTLRAARHAALQLPGGPVWNGGTLAPITVEAYAGPAAPAAAPVRPALPATGAT